MNNQYFREPYNADEIDLAKKEGVIIIDEEGLNL